MPVVRSILRGARTDEAKAIRRQYGDNKGRCHFADRFYFPFRGGYCFALTSVLKDNLIHVEYQI